MANRLVGKVAIVTGGASGIGEATVRRFVAEGACVVIGDLNRERGDALQKELGEQALFVPINVAKQEEWENLKAKTLEAFGTLDILVNNAGMSVAKSIFEMTPEEYTRIFEVNQLSVFLGTKILAPIMVEKGAGSIINTSSINGIKAGSIGYTDSKFAVRGLTKAASKELAPQGVRVNSVHPGVIETPMTMEGDAVEQIKAFANYIPMKRTAKAEEVANLILYLASDESSYSTGSEFIVDGGLTQ